MPEKVINHDDEDLASFLVEDYQLKADYLSEHFSRMWTRFNFFLSVETALFGVAFLADKDEWSKHAVLFAGFGVLVSLFWYVFGAQDRYLVELYRDEIKFAAQRLAKRFEKRLGSDGYQSLFFNYRYIGDTADKAEGIRPGLFQWRCAAISVTRLAAIFPAALMVTWAIMIGLLAMSK